MARVIEVSRSQVEAAKLVLEMHERQDRIVRHKWWELWKPKPYFKPLKDWEKDAIVQIANARKMTKEQIKDMTDTG